MHRQLRAAARAARRGARARAARSRARPAPRPVSRVQRFQGGVKNGSSAVAQQLAQPLLPARDVRALLAARRAPGRTRTCAPRPGGWCARSRAGAGRRGVAASARRERRRSAPPGSPRGRAAARARRSGRSARAGARRPSRRRRRGRRPRPAERSRSSESKRFLKSVTLGRAGLSPDCERVRRLHPDGVPAGLRDVHRVGDPPGRAGRRAAAPVRHQAGRGARAGARSPGPRRDRGHAGVPAGPEGADEAAAPVALRATCASSLPALRRCVARAPARRRARRRGPRSRQAFRDRRTPLQRPAQDLHQGADPGDHARGPRSTRPTSATCTRTSRTGRRRSPGWRRASPACRSRFTGHARDIYAPELNPKGWLRRKLLAARFVVTCTEANVAHLQRDRAAGATSTSSTTASPRTSRDLLRADGDAPRAQRPPAHPRRRPARRQEGLRHARRRVRGAAASAASRSTR